MDEALVAYIWETGQMSLPLYTTDGDPIEIVRSGTMNGDAGPDFFNARIMIGDTEWAGNVEVHVKSSDWVKHKHDRDVAYDNIILHVVFDHDANVGVDCPTLELRSYVSERLIDRYKAISDGDRRKDDVCCQSLIKDVDPFLLGWQIERMFVERLRNKTERIFRILDENGGDWNSAFHVVLMSSFGFKINNLPFELLAKSANYSVVNRYKSSLADVEALLFGQAGMLDDAGVSDYYYVDLRGRYERIRAIEGLCQMDASIWKFARTQPKNFPTVRIAQLARLLVKSERLFERIVETEDVSAIRAMLHVDLTDGYWVTHNLFGKESGAKAKNLGVSSVESLIMNAVIPMLFAYNSYHNTEDDCLDLIFDFYKTIKPENNTIVRKWEACGIVPKNGLQTQGLMELYNSYCSKHRCLSCHIGHKCISG